MNFRQPSEYPGLSSADMNLIENITAFTRDFFQNPKFDSSHDFQHVLRVTNTAMEILHEELSRGKGGPSTKTLNPTIVIIGALLHDVEDKKYSESATSEAAPKSDIKSTLLRFHAGESLTVAVTDLVPMVSFSMESRNPIAVSEMIQRIPELAIIQDADRLDAIGAIGIARCFTFGGAKATQGLANAIEHFEEKLLKLESMMKTDTGRRMAAIRSSRIREFMSWWVDEKGPVTGLVRD